jgi:hypothetical protein
MAGGIVMAMFGLWVVLQSAKGPLVQLVTGVSAPTSTTAPTSSSSSSAKTSKKTSSSAPSSIPGDIGQGLGDAFQFGAGLFG